MAEKTRLALLTDAAGTVLALDEWAMSHGGFSYVLSTVSNRPETVLYVFARPAA